jgi:hypothetical protein
VACTNLLGETEALEMMPDGLILLGIVFKRILSPQRDTIRKIVQTDTIPQKDTIRKIKAPYHK